MNASITSARDQNCRSALDGVAAVDLTSSVAGQYAAKLLAMNGADVILVEPPEGNSMRRRGRPVPAGNETFLFRHLNQGKRSMSLDLNVASHAATLADLVRRADVLLRDEVRDSGVIIEIPETTIECSITQAPDNSEYSKWSLDEMSHQALSGVMNMTGSVDREPVYGVGERGSYAAGTTAYISIVSALYERRKSGLGQRVDATVFESLAAMGQNLVSQFSYNRTAENRARYPGFLALVRCADAWVVMFAIRNWPTLCEVFNLPELLSDPRYQTSGDRLARWPQIVEAIQEKAWELKADYVVDACQRGRVSAEKVVELEELVQSEQWEVRRILSSVAGQDGQPDQVALRNIFEIAGARSEIRTASPPLSPIESRCGEVVP